jgi:hypothetical protein
VAIILGVAQWKICFFSFWLQSKALSFPHRRDSLANLQRQNFAWIAGWQGSPKALCAQADEKQQHGDECPDDDN